MRFVLFHSPLVGPSTWRWVAGSLRAAGHEVVVPDLRASALAASPHALITTAAAAVPDGWSELVLVGHSGFGSFLPSIAERHPGREPTIVFVDAGLPPLQGAATPSADFLTHLRNLAVDGVLPKWSTWWGEGAMEALVPDASRRTEIEAEMPEVPLPFFESAFDVPRDWADTRASFLLLSDSYRDDAERARTLGWPTMHRPGGHLDIVNDPDATADAITVLSS